MEAGGLPAGVEETAELEQVRAVGLERVARQPALEFEVGEEVQHQVLEGLQLRGALDRGHGAAFAQPPSSPLRCKAALSRKCGAP